jgi:hypothetical protein
MYVAFNDSATHQQKIERFVGAGLRKMKIGADADVAGKSELPQSA